MQGLETGDILGQRYLVEAPFLICRFSTLYHAKDLKNEQPRVLRLLRLPPAGDEKRRADMRVQIEREGQVLAQLRHPNLPTVLEVWHDDDRTILVLEHFSGSTLDVFAKEAGVVDLATFWRIAGQLTRVLEYLHGLEPPIIHRDLRPHSLIMTRDGVVKVAEFGLARIHEPNASGPKKTLFRTEGNSTYAPPEQLMDTPSSPANDIYSLGCVLYFLLTQEHPPRSLSRITNTAPLRPISEFRDDVPAPLEAIVTRMMEPVAERRYASVSEVVTDLHGAFPTSP